METIDIKPIINAAVSGGEIVKNYFGQSLETEEKTTASDFRTKADIESEAKIIKQIKNDFPNFNIFSEETSFINNHSEYTFIIDPLDGTNNFFLGIPNFSVSIGLLKGDRVILGVVYLPMLNNIYHAKDGEGSFLNNKRIFVNKESNIKNSTASYTCGYTTNRKHIIKVKDKLNDLGIKRMLDCWSPAADFCLLASGKIEAVINNNNEIYDYAAGKIIAREAGAIITDFHGGKEENNRNGQFLISNNTSLHQEILAVL